MALSERLALIVSFGSSDTTDYHIASELRRLSKDLGAMSIAEVAERCSVSKSTLSKFVRTLGYEDYAEFKEDAGNYWRKETYVPTGSASRDVNITDFLCECGEHSYAEVLKRDIDVLLAADPGPFLRAARLIHESDDIMALGRGYSGTAAVNFRRKMGFYRKLVFCTENEDEQLRCIRKAREGSVIFVFSNSGRFISSYEGHDGFSPRHDFDDCAATVVLVTANLAMAADKRVDLPIFIPQTGPVRNHPFLFQLAIERIASAYQQAFGFPAGMEQW